MICRPFRQTSSNGNYGSRRSIFGLLQRPSSTFHGSSISSIADILRLVSPLGSQAPCHVEVTGHVRTIRNQKRRSFVELGDGSTIRSLQALLEPEQAKGLNRGTAVNISGLWRQCPTGKEQDHELHAQKVEIVGETDPESYPIQKKAQTAEHLRTIPHMRLRTPLNALLARLRSECEYYVSRFFHDRQFVRLHPPIITSSDCEGAGEVFSLSPKEPHNLLHKGQIRTVGLVEDFFRDPKYLTVSSQLHLEAFVHEHQKVWTLSPTFRAEKSDTPRHLSEFYMLEAEIRTTRLEDVMELVEDLIRFVAVQVRDCTVGKELISIEYIPESRGGETLPSRVDVIQRRWQGLARGTWPRITYRKAIEILQAASDAKQTTFSFNPSWHTGLQLEHEKYIAAEIGQGSPVFVTDYPKGIKPFYMLPSEANLRGSGPTVACFDLLLPEMCEVVGGSLREHRLKQLIQSMRQHGLYTGNEINSESQNQKISATGGAGNLEWYLDLRRYGGVPHGGFGLGFDRLLGYLAGIDNVRDVVLFPRYFGKCDC